MSTDPDRIRYDIEAARAELSSDVDALTDRINPRRIAAAPVDRARGRLSRMVDTIMGNARHARDVASHQASGVTQRASATTHRLSDTTQRVTGTAQHGATTAGERARGLTHASRERAEGNPLAAGLIAFGVGALASSLLRPSHKERELAERVKHEAMEHSDQFTQQVGEAQHIRDDAREAPRGW